MIADTGVTNPAPGVIDTRPTTAPVAAPNKVGFLYRIYSIKIHESIAEAAAVFVVIKALEARFPADSALPALNPNQPNHKMPVPISTKGILWGIIWILPYPFLLPITIAETKPAIPELIWTTVPPAKSRAFNLNNQPSGCHTQWARGSYTRVVQSNMNTINTGNFILSANEPVIIAAVIIANISWYIAKIPVGIVPVRVPVIPLNPAKSKLPSKPEPVSVPNARV